MNLCSLQNQNQLHFLLQKQNIQTFLVIIQVISILIVKSIFLKGYKQIQQLLIFGF
ncbi:hypothetical protein pb186bvf_014987 [Paramecium bursaria]